MLPISKSSLEHTAPFAAAVLVASFVSAILRVVPHYFPGMSLHALPRAVPHLPTNIDFGVVALFVPLCALILAVMVQAAQLVRQGGLPDETQPHARAIPHWQDAGI